MRISGAESLVMEALWASSPLTAEEIINVVAGPQAWSEGTVKTLINRLLKKKAIAAEPVGRRYSYRPLVRREDYIHAESQGLLDRLFDGRLTPLVSHFSQRQSLSDKDVAELKRLIAEIENGR